MLKNTGVATGDLVKNAYPAEERRAKGAFAVMECFQSIPCNPCQNACKRGAILPMEDINQLPQVDFDKCNGCTVCASQCPGLAIFIIDETFSKDEALVKLPYEFSPLPLKGETVLGLDREGKEVCKAVVESVVDLKMNDRTPIVALRMPKEFAMTVRFFAKNGDFKQSGCGCAALESSGVDTNEASLHDYVCRCEEITVADIKVMISKGYTTPDEIKRVSRAGMGACQGRTCRNLILNIIAQETGINPINIPITTFRPPVKPIKMSILCQDNGDSHKAESKDSGAKAKKGSK